MSWNTMKKWSGRPSCRELARGGQVYYVYNRVNQIAEVAAKIAELVPEANVAFAHGQMKETGTGAHHVWFYQR